MFNTLKFSRSMLIGCLLLMTATSSLAQGAPTKPWVEDFAGFANSTRDKTWIVAHSTTPCLSETEAFEAACRDGSAQLLSRIRPRMARPYGAGSDAWLMGRLNQEIASGSLVADRFVSRVHRPYGDIWSEAILVDVSSARLGSIAREHAIWLSGRQHARRGAAASIVGMSVAILLIYAVVNAVTKGYFRGYLRTGAALGMALCVMGLWHVMRGTG